MLETVKRAVCDRCLKGGPLALESESPAELARDDGWTVETDTDPERGEDLCPACIGERRKLDDVRMDAAGQAGGIM